MTAVDVNTIIMTAEAKSVNRKKGGYHHGDLRTALIRAGLELLADRDVETFSLREVARVVGVTATSVYRHFPDKQALMTALALEGLTQLFDAQHRAVAETRNGAEAFAAAGRAYVRFALANPALFRLIFASPLMTPDTMNGIAADIPRMMGDNAPPTVLGFLESLAAAKGDDDMLVSAVRGYAMVHGLATLMLDGQIAADDALIDSVVKVARTAK